MLNESKSAKAAGEDKRCAAEQEEYVRNGFPVLPSRGGGMATHELVKRLLDEEDAELIGRSYGGSST